MTKTEFEYVKQHHPTLRLVFGTKFKPYPIDDQTICYDFLYLRNYDIKEDQWISIKGYYLEYNDDEAIYYISRRAGYGIGLLYENIDIVDLIRSYEVGDVI